MELADVVARLGDQIAPITLAKERTIPVAEPLGDLFAERAIVRGRVMACQGAAASSIALMAVRDAMRAGGWLAAIDVPTFGADAAAELGVPLERVVRVDVATVASATSPEAVAADWVDVMGAAADGFELIVTKVPAALRNDRRPAAVRKLATRIQQRGAVVLVLGDTGALASDVTMSTVGSAWSGLGRGAGHLRHRMVEIEASGRRQPGMRRCSVELSGASGRVDIASAVITAGDPVVRSLSPVIDTADTAETADTTTANGDLDPQAQVLAEMQAGLDDGAVIARSSDHRVAG